MADRDSIRHQAVQIQGRNFDLGPSALGEIKNGSEGSVNSGLDREHLL
jgi:hypothetical protein